MVRERRPIATALRLAIPAARHVAWWLEYQCAPSRSRCSRPRNDDTGEIRLDDRDDQRVLSPRAPSPVLAPPS